MLLTVRQRVILIAEFQLNVPTGVSTESFVEDILSNDPACNNQPEEFDVEYDYNTEQVISTTIEDEYGNVLGKWVANTGK